MVVLPSPSALTVNRRRLSVGGAESENGCAVSQWSGVRNRQRKNCPGSAPSSSRCWPASSMLTTPGPSERTAATCSRWGAGARPERRQQPMAQQQREDVDVERGPPDLEQPVAGEIRPGELVQEAE